MEYKQAKILSNNSHPLKYNKSTENLISGNIHGGLLQTPPPRFLSDSSFQTHHQYYNNPFIHLQIQQPPLLPSPSSPISQRTHRSVPSHQVRSQSLNPIRKSKPTKRDLQEPKPAIDHRFPLKNRLNKSKIDLAGNASRVSSPSPINKRVVAIEEEFDELSGYFFTISPPPSSLPLPKFSLKPTKLSCNVEAAGVDPGATDDLRRLLHLP